MGALRKAPGSNGQSAGGHANGWSMRTDGDE